MTNISPEDPLTQKVVKSVQNFKSSIYDLATYASELKPMKYIEGLKQKDFFESVARIDNSFVKFSLDLLAKVPEPDSYGYTLKQLKDLIKDKTEEKPEKQHYLTIKLNEHQKEVFTKALEKFCLEHGISKENAGSFFVETRAAEYLAEVVHED